jgi:FkbM family methyltransferase
MASFAEETWPLQYNSVGKWTICSITGDEYIGPWLSHGGEWENWMRKDMELIYKPGTDILDIGGNIGCNALMFSDYGQVHTFEPLFHNIIQKNIEENQIANSITIHPFGLSSEEGAQNIYMPKVRNGLFNYGCCSLHPNEFNHSDESFVIQLRKLDDVYTGTPGVIKIDVEGHEMDVLKGAEKTIREHMPALIVEIHKVEESQIPVYLGILGYTKMIPRPHSNYLFLP